MHDDLLVAVEVLGAIHDRYDTGQSDPPPDGGGDSSWPEGDALNHPA